MSFLRPLKEIPQTFSFSWDKAFFSVFFGRILLQEKIILIRDYGIRRTP